MHESKTSLYEDPNQLHNSIAAARGSFAILFTHLDQEALGDEILDRYAVSADDCAT